MPEQSPFSPVQTDTAHVKAADVERRGHRIEDSRIRWKRRLPWIALLPAGVLLMVVGGWFPRAVEVVYSNGIFPVIGQSLGLITGWVPFSLGEMLVLAACGWIFWRIGRAIAKVVNHSRSVRNTLKHMAVNAVAVASTVYFAFVIVWGLNYQRQSLAEFAGYDTSPATVKELEDTANALILRANKLRSKALENDSGVMTLRVEQSELFERVAEGYVEVAKAIEQLEGRYGKPKGVLFSPLMSYLGISGIYFPFTGEANINTTQPDCMLAFTACHEMAHQRGIGREDEANFLGYLACVKNKDSDIAYSGMMMAARYALIALAETDMAAFKRVRANVSEGVLRDFAAIRAWQERYETKIAEVSSAVNNVYLQAQGESDGVKSYGRMVDLLIAEHRSDMASRK